MSAPLLISLPRGFATSGIVTWARALAAALVPRRHVALVVHAHDSDSPPHAPDQQRAGVRVRTIPGVADLDGCGGDYAPYLPAYRTTLRDLMAAASEPVVCIPTFTAECWGLFAHLSREREFASRLRVLSWQHNDIPYDLQTLRWFEALSAAFVGVSTQIAALQRSAMPARAGDVFHVPYGVPVPDRPALRPPLRARPLKLIYTGRLEHAQKRLGALLRMSDVLRERAVDHRLLLVGDGPASEEARTAARTNPCIALHRNGAAATADEVRALLDDADAFVLASRFEGLSVSMLEAMSRACVPIVTRVRSGAADAIEHGDNGLLVNFAPADDDDRVGAAMADAVQTFVRAGDEQVRAMSAAAWRTARTNFDLSIHAQRASEAIDAAARAPARRWPDDRACSPARAGSEGVSGGGSMTVPPDAAARAARALAELAPLPVALWGGGRHTAALQSAVAHSPAPVVGVIDDDPARWGQRCAGVPVMSPERAIELGARAVLISSWMHEADMWAQRARFESRGVVVRRMYE